MKMEQTECSETSAYIIQTPGNYPKEIIQHSEQGEILKSRFVWLSPTINRLKALQHRKISQALYNSYMFVELNLLNNIVTWLEAVYTVKCI